MFWIIGNIIKQYTWMANSCAPVSVTVKHLVTNVFTWYRSCLLATSYWIAKVVKETWKPFQGAVSHDVYIKEIFVLSTAGKQKLMKELINYISTYK